MVSGIFLFLVCFCCISLYAEQTSPTAINKWAVFHPHQFAKSEYCQTLRCSSDELCVVNEKTARCIKKDKLYDADGSHIDLANGQQIHNRSEERSHHANGSVKPQHKHGHLPRRYDRAETREHECDEKELHSVGGRLMQWFNEMHKLATTESELPLRKHKTVCRADVAWMFQQWDGNDDGKLTIKELAPLEADANENCLKAYLDRCDTEPGSDDVLTLDEWCDCFAWADNDRHEPPCHAAKHRQDPHLLGAFHPRCTLEGYYKAEQCHQNSCWCVDKYGREFEKSRVTGRLPDCEQYASVMNEEERKDLAAEL